MKWLLWKDYRNNRLVVFAALAFLLTPHLGTLIMTCLQEFRWHVSTPHLWIDNFAASSFFSLTVSQLLVAVIGGNAIAGERADRSAEFLASLPITRKKILASKLLLSLAIVAVIWVTDVAALLYLGFQLPRRFDPTGIVEMLGVTAIVASVLFSVAWCLSSFLASATYCVAAGVFTPLLLWLGMLYVAFLFDIEIGDEHFERTITFWYCGICLTLAPVCFGAGTWYYLRRVEP
jgi:ABC-type transport system involved in multi-copper enzyme maturation permease subunit